MRYETKKIQYDTKKYIDSKSLKDLSELVEIMEHQALNVRVDEKELYELNYTFLDSKIKNGGLEDNFMGIFKYSKKRLKELKRQYENDEEME